MADLRKQGIVTKARRLRSGQTVGGIPFTRGPLAYLLRNRFYVGEVVFKGETLPGEQPAIVDRALFDAVQAKLNQQINNHKQVRSASEALLAGRLFDDRGNRMTPSHARKGAIKYRYYISSALVQGQTEQAGCISRVPAQEIEAIVARSVREHLGQPTDREDAALIRDHVVRVEVKSDRLMIELTAPRMSTQSEKELRSRSRSLGAKHHPLGGVRSWCPHRTDRDAADGVDGVEQARLLDQQQPALAGVGQAGADRDALVLLADADEPRVGLFGERPQQAFAGGDVGHRDDELDPARLDFADDAFAGKPGHRPALRHTCTRTHWHFQPPALSGRMLARGK